MSRTTVVLVLMASAVAGVGADCDPNASDKEVSIYALTPPPPGRTATVEERDLDLHREANIRLTQGVALAVRCWESCEYTCDAPTMEVADTTIAAARPISRQGLGGEFAVVGTKVGTTSATVTTQCGTKTYRVDVVAE